MRRKSERTPAKAKTAAAVEKVEVPEKPKRLRSSRRKKESTSSESEVIEETKKDTQVLISEPSSKSPLKVQTPTKDDTEEKVDQVWQVRTSESSDSGEIQKLKLCLTRPLHPSTPELPEKTTRTRRKLNRDTGSSDSPSVENIEDKKKPKHKSRKHRECKERHDKEAESQDDERSEKAGNAEQATTSVNAKCTVINEVPVSTTIDDKDNVTEIVTSVADLKKQDPQAKDLQIEDGEKHPQADTTTDIVLETKVIKVKSPETSETCFPGNSQNIVEESTETLENKSDNVNNQGRNELQVVVSDSLNTNNKDNAQEDLSSNRNNSHDETESYKELSDKGIQGSESDNVHESESNEEPILELSAQEELPEAERLPDRFSPEKKDNIDPVVNIKGQELKNTEMENKCHEPLNHCDSVEASTEFQLIPLTITRKRRWGKSSKGTKHPPVNISTDILKDIIPDVQPVEFEEVIEDKKVKKTERNKPEKIDRPVLPKIVIDNTEQVNIIGNFTDEGDKSKEHMPLSNRKISIVKEEDSIINRPPSPPRHKTSCILYITNLVRPFTLPQLKNLLQRTGRMVEGGFWIDRIKSKCYVKYENEDQAIETRHALHGVTWPVSNPKTLQVDFSSDEAMVMAKENEENSTAPVSAIPGTVEDWLKEQDAKKEKKVMDESKPWERRNLVREWDVGKGDKDSKDKLTKDDRGFEKRRPRSSDKSPEPARKFKKKEEEPPAKLLDDLFRKTKTIPCIYWLPLSAETIAIKEEQRRKHMEEHERRQQELRKARHRN